MSIIYWSRYNNDKLRIDLLKIKQKQIREK